MMECLRREYSGRFQLRPLPWSETLKLPLGDFYTSLKMRSRRQKDLKLENNEVEIYDIFNTIKKTDGFTVLVEGSLGNGKTTLCLKIAYDWANGRIHEFEVVLLLKCQYINGDIFEAIQEQLLLKDEDLKKKLMDYIHNQGNVLIILDDLDKLPKGGGRHVGRLLQKPFCSILATSRQGKGEVGLNVNFDAVLQLEGFREADSFEYIEKYFKHLGPEHLLVGKKLIQAVQGNSLLHVLITNPLILVFLCDVVAKDEGRILSSCTKICQVIVRYILRNYCAENSLKVPDGEDNIEKQFKSSVMVLGNLAEKCLLEGDVSFHEKELEICERKYDDRHARNIGLVIKEASSSIYFFSHKTFQLYLFAAYLALKLLDKEVNIFKALQLDFHDHIVGKYRQAFLFLSGILGERASILFTQIGEKLESENWDWLECKEEEGSFFTESFAETGNAEQAANDLFAIIPFPVACDRAPFNKGFLIVAEYCKNFLNLQCPYYLDASHDTGGKIVGECC